MDIFDKQEYLVSVRLMTYNHEQYIADAMKGVLMQKTEFKVELVVGDDFSTDKTLEIIKSFDSTENIEINILNRAIGDEYWVTRQEFGRMHNFINILENCSGKYIALLDGDDYWTDPYKLQKQVNALVAYPGCDMCIHPARILVGKKMKGLLNNYGKGEYVISSEQVLASSGSIAPTPSYLFKASVLKNLPDWFNRVHVADVFIEIFGSLNGGILYYPEEMAVYRKNASGSWSERRNKLSRDGQIKQTKEAKKSYSYLKNSIQPEFLAALERRLSYLEFRIIQLETYAFLENRDYKNYRKRIEELIIYQRLHGIKHLKIEDRILYGLRNLNIFTFFLHKFFSRLS